MWLWVVIVPCRSTSRSPRRMPSGFRPPPRRTGWSVQAFDPIPIPLTACGVLRRSTHERGVQKSKPKQPKQKNLYCFIQETMMKPCVSSGGLDHPAISFRAAAQSDTHCSSQLLQVPVSCINSTFRQTRQNLLQHQDWNKLFREAVPLPKRDDYGGTSGNTQHLLIKSFLILLVMN